MPDQPLTVEQATQAAGANEHGRAHCPVCDPEGIFSDELRLTISPNGNGAHLQCSNGCPATTITAHLRKALRAAAAQPSAEQQRQTNLDLARGFLECDALDGVIQRGREDPIFDLRFTLNDGHQVVIAIGPMGHLKDPRKVEDVIAEITGRMPPYFTVPKFRPIVNALLGAKEIDDTGSSNRAVTRSWLAAFASQNARGPYDPTDSDQRDELARATGFWSPRQELFIHVPSLGDYLRTYKRIFVDDRDLVARLRRLDFNRERIEGKRSQRGQTIPKRVFWRSPPDLDLSEEA